MIHIIGFALACGLVFDALKPCAKCIHENKDLLRPVDEAPPRTRDRDNLWSGGAPAALIIERGEASRAM